MRNKITNCLLFCAFILGLPHSVNAQELKTKFKKLERDLIARTHPRFDFNEEPCAVIRVSAANIDTYTFEGNIVGNVVYESGEALVYMAKNSRNITVKSNKFGMMTIDFPEKLEKQVTYKLDLRLILTEDQKRKTLVMLEGGWHPSQTSFGAMVGIVAKHGAYLRFRSNFGSISTDLECNDTGILTSGGGGTPYYNKNSSSKARLSITGGYLCRIAKPLYGLVGLGYGNRVLAWETIDNKLVKNIDHSACGIAAEVGIIGRFRNFAISFSTQSLNFKYMEISAGLGFFF